MSANLDALRLLFPLELGGDHDADLQIDAGSLDRAQTSAEALLNEMFPDMTSAFLADWERVAGLTTGPDDPLQYRRQRLLVQLNAIGGLSIPYFIHLADSLGYVITIVEPVPSMAEWACADDELLGAAVDGEWGVWITGVPLYYARAGETAADERLLWWPSQTDLEDLFTALTPAHQRVYFIYD